MQGNVARIADSHVMGRLPVMVTVTFVAAAGVGQLADSLGSRVLTEWGGEHLNIVWSICAFLAAALVWGARFWPTPQDAALLEIGGIALMAVDLAVYVIAVVTERGLVGNLLPLGVLTAVTINMLGRAVILAYKRVLVARVVSETTDG